MKPKRRRTKVKAWTFDRWYAEQFGARPHRESLDELGNRAAQAKYRAERAQSEYSACLAWENRYNHCRLVWNLRDADKLTPPAKRRAKR